MSIEVTPIVRTFTYSGILLPDVPGLSPREVRDLYSAQYPELVSAEVEAGPVANGRQDFTFRKAVGTKGAGQSEQPGPRLAALLTQHQPSQVVIELGGNDALRGLPLKNTEENLTWMVQTAQKSGAKVLLVGMQVTGLPIDYAVTRNEKIEAVTMEDIRRVAKRIFLPEELHFVVVGQPAGL